MNVVVVAWIKRIFGFIAFLVNFAIFKREYSNRRIRSKSEPKDATGNIYLKLLNLWSIMTLILVTITSLIWFIALWPSVICGYFIGISNIVTGPNIRIFLTFYQISRLQYCFLDKQIHSTKYGYLIFYFIFYIYLV